MQDRRGAGRYNRRVQLLQPKTVTDEYNEAKTEFVVVFDMYPAQRMDTTSTKDEEQSNRIVKGLAVVEWRLRYIPTLDIRIDWEIKDLLDGKTYEVIEPATEIGRQEAIRVLTKIVQ